MMAFLDLIVMNNLTLKAAAIAESSCRVGAKIPIPQVLAAFHAPSVCSLTYPAERREYLDSVQVKIDCDVPGEIPQVASQSLHGLFPPEFI